MSPNLPPVLPTRSSAPRVVGGGVNRAQNLSITKLNQERDRESSRVSVSQLMRSKREGEDSTSSYMTISDQERDENRGAHVRDLMFKKKSDEKKIQQKQIGTMFGGSAKKPKEIMKKLVDKYSWKKSIGKGYGLKERKDMSKSIDYSVSKGKISKDEAGKMKEFIKKVK